MKTLARLFGWQEARDFDMDLLVVWHSAKRVHFSGADAWRHAVVFSVYTFLHP